MSAAPSDIMRPGVLTAAGTLFLRAGVYEARTSGGEVLYQFLLRSREGLHSEAYVGFWSGPEAETFVRAHRDALKPGCALTVTLHRLRIVSGEILATIYSASMAPARWQHPPAPQEADADGAATAPPHVPDATVTLASSASADACTTLTHQEHPA
jgi:hypothetical protein